MLITMLPLIFEYFYYISYSHLERVLPLEICVENVSSECVKIGGSDPKKLEGKGPLAAPSLRLLPRVACPTVAS